MGTSGENITIGERPAGEGRGGAGWTNAAAALLIGLGAVGGFLWNEAGWWPAGVDEPEPAPVALEPSERAWCEGRTALVVMSGDTLGFITAEFKSAHGRDTVVALEDLDPVLFADLPPTAEANLDLFRSYFDFAQGFGNPGLSRPFDFVIDPTYLRSTEWVNGFGEVWVTQYQATWNSGPVIDACRAAYAAFR